MKVRFPRLADGRRSYSVAERADGVRYRIHEGIAGHEIPHDLVHLVVERATGDDGGFWGAVAAGAVFDSMEHLDGRRPPHAGERSDAAKRARANTLQRAELMAAVVQRVAAEAAVTVDAVRRIAREELSTLPDPAVDEARVVDAAEQLNAVARRWAALDETGEVVVDWPEGGRRRSQSRLRGTSRRSR